jgi:sugar transferase (PEP-CTERM/EpsH1 system associated)
MKILVLDEEFPFPLNTGKRIRSFNLLSRLATRHEVYYLAYGNGLSDGFKALKAAGMNPIAVNHEIQKKSGLVFYFKLFINLFSSDPYIVSSHYSESFLDKFREVLKDFNPDILLAEWTPYAKYLSTVVAVKKIIVTHNIENRIWERYYRNESNLLKKYFIYLQWRKLLNFERNMLFFADGLTTVSDLERNEFLALNDRLSIEVIDNGVDLDYFKPEVKIDPTGHSLVFTGSMDWRPNQDSIRYFMSDIHPLLLKQCPDYTITIVGRNPPPDIMRYNNYDYVTVTGTVDDVRPYIAGAQVYIVPLRIGGGSRLKILEAMAMGKPVVSTSIGAEGLAVTPDTDIILADDPATFTASILRLFADPGLRKYVGSAGRLLVERLYDWDRLSHKLEAFIRRIASL